MVYLDGHWPVTRRAIQREMAGPIERMIRSRATCMDITNDMSTLVEAAMMAAESTPPGLVARYAVSGSTPTVLTSTQARLAQKAISRIIDIIVCGKVRVAWSRV